MPLYDYECPTGHVAIDVFHPMNHADPVCCPICGEVMHKLPSLVHTDLKPFHIPIVMHSIGCTDMGQIREMQKAGVSISDDPRDENFGVPIAHTRHEKLKALKVAKFQEGN